MKKNKKYINIFIVYIMYAYTLQTAEEHVITKSDQFCIELNHEENECIELTAEQDAIKLIPLDSLKKVKKSKNSYVPASLGLLTSSAMLIGGRLLEQSHASEKRFFIIDDIFAAGAASQTLQNLTTPLLALVAGFLTYRQIDFYLHAEERQHFIVLEDKFQRTIKDLQKNIAQEFALRDKKRVLESKHIVQYVQQSHNQAFTPLKKEIDELQQHLEKHADLFISLEQEMHTNNQQVMHKLKQAQEVYQKGTSKMQEVQTSIAESKLNLAKMEQKLKSMMPLMTSIHDEIINRKTQRELMKITIPGSQKSDSEEEKEDIHEIKPTQAKKFNAAWLQIFSNSSNPKK